MKFNEIHIHTVHYTTIGRFQGANTSASFVQDDRPWIFFSQMKDHRKSLRRTAWVLHSKAFEARALWHATPQWPWQSLPKNNTLVSGSEDLEVSVQDSLIRVFVKWVLTKNVYWKKSLYGWILRISCSSPKRPTPYSHTSISIHFVLSPPCQQNVPNPKKGFYSDSVPSETERHESIQDSWKGWRQASETSCCRALRISDVTCSLYSFKWASLDLDNLDNCQNNKFDPICEASLHQWGENRT